MPFLLFLLSVATLVAVSSKSNAKGTNGRNQTFTLDVNMPDALRNQVLAALVSGTDPATLDAFALAIQAQYPLSAGLLHAKATTLRGGLSASPSLPAPMPDPGGPPLDLSMPASMAAFIHSELANETDPNKLLALANTIAAQYPLAANLLTQRAGTLNVQPAQSPPVVPPAPQPAPANPSVPALNMPGLDPGMPADLAQAVMTALSTETNPAKLQGEAQEIGGTYPLAAGLLNARANALLATQSPAGVPSGSQVGLDANMPPATVQLVMTELATEADPTKLETLADQLAPQYPTAAGLLRTRANVILATRPPMQIVPGPSAPSVISTYAVKAGDFPWKIATQYTGQGARWPELVAANPQKARAKDGNFASLLPGERLSLPGSWVTPAAPSAPPAAAAANPPPLDLSATTLPVIAPSPPAPGLDANIPSNVASAVTNALQTGTDPSQLHGFATAIAPRYPAAANLLATKANALAIPSPSGAASYRVKAGDSPSKIAASLVGNGNRWKELVAANPQKKIAANGNFASLVPGEILQLPPSWSANGAPAQGRA
jgi:nucleoid-associated protein YgaU